MLLVNVGCGATPTPGWLNIDNSFTVRFARLFAAVPSSRRAFARAALAGHVRWGQATQLPLSSGAARAVYSCHMLEHLRRQDGARFLVEAHRVIRPGGILRLVLPDLLQLAKRYLKDGDADAFVRDSLLVEDAHPIRAALFGRRHHQWMYDVSSAARAARAAGFVEVRDTPFGETRIPEPGALDLREREVGSFCVEAVRP